jgi:hypothetical protein
MPIVLQWKTNISREGKYPFPHIFLSAIEHNKEIDEIELKFFLSY